MAGLILLGLLVLQAAGADISNTTRKASGRLWSMDTTNDLHKRIFTELIHYAKHCCVYVAGNQPAKCDTMQLGYWAWLPQGMSEADMFVILDGMFNPEDPFSSAVDICNEYFAAAEPGTDGNAHTEAVLLPRLEKKAQESTNSQPPTPTNFFLYTRGSPCCSYDNGCLRKIFDSTFKYIYPLQRNFHSMTVGFDRWYTRGGTQEPKDARKNFCNRVTEYKTDTKYDDVDFYHQRLGLKFKKFSEDPNIEPSDTEFDQEQNLQGDRPC